MRFPQMKWQAKEKITFFWDTLYMDTAFRNSVGLNHEMHKERIK